MRINHTLFIQNDNMKIDAEVVTGKNMMGDRATINFSYVDEGYHIDETFDLVKENEK